MSAAHDIVFGLLVALLAGGCVVAGVLAARHDDRVEPRWLRRSVGFGAGAFGVMGVWVATIVATAPSV